MRRMLRPLPLGGLTSGSTGLAASESLKFNLAGSPVIRGVRWLPPLSLQILWLN